ncbi:GatB/YqeY domain-containing protein [Patescibacteria group bacterium]|nr:GatB/YqeY domain-containing protein [Patescibacteria group bacterium]MCH7756604.1 GatB/YqeY domain-containing protein [Patescibacteria group bacterium]
MLHRQIKEEIKGALRERDELRLSVLRGLLASFTNEVIARGRKPDGMLSDEEAIAVIKRAVKQRKESIEQFNKGGRPELAQKEQQELEMLKVYLPEAMSALEIEKVARAKKSELEITDKSKSGLLVGAVMKELKGNADGALVKKIVEGLLSV